MDGRSLRRGLGWCTIALLAGCLGKFQVAEGDAGADMGPGVDLPGETEGALVACDPAKWTGVSIDDIATRYANQVHPLVTTGCLACHDAQSGRQLVVTNDAKETFYAARAAGLFSEAPGSILDRLLSTDPVAKMPPAAPWPAGQIQAVADVVCMLKAYVAPPMAPPPDEEFPPGLLQPYAGPASDYYDNTFLSYRQLKAKVKAVFADDWVRGGVDQFQKNISLFGGVDFTQRFVEARDATADFLLGLDALGKAVCDQATAMKTGPFTAFDPTQPVTGSAGADADAQARVGLLYQRVLFRGATAAEQTAGHALLKDLVGLGSTPQGAWSGLCQGLVRHPDFLFTLPPSYATATGQEKQGLLLVKIAQDLVGRPPAQAELSALASGAKTLEQSIDAYLAAPEFRDFYFHRMRLRTESAGTQESDEPARLWTWLAVNGQPFADLFLADYTVDAAYAKQTRPAYHGKTGVLTMKGYIKNKPGLPHYNYAARVLTDFMGVLFEVPQSVLDARATATASSTVDPTSVCYACHQTLTPLAHQRARWDDDGTYRETDAAGKPIDDTDRALVAGYPFKGAGIQAFAAQAVKKEIFIRRMLNAQFMLFFGRELRHTADERVLYKKLWDVSVSSSGNLKEILKAIILSPTYRGI